MRSANKESFLAYGHKNYGRKHFSRLENYRIGSDAHEAFRLLNTYKKKHWSILKT